MTFVKRSDYINLVKNHGFTAIDFNYIQHLDSYLVSDSAKRKYELYKMENSLILAGDEFDYTNSVTTIQYDKLFDDILKDYSAMYRLFGRSGIMTTFFVNKNNLLQDPYIKIFRKGRGVIDIHVNAVQPLDIISSKWLKEFKTKQLKNMINK